MFELEYLFLALGPIGPKLVPKLIPPQEKFLETIELLCSTFFQMSCSDHKCAIKIRVLI